MEAMLLALYCGAFRELPDAQQTCSLVYINLQAVKRKKFSLLPCERGASCAD